MPCSSSDSSFQGRLSRSTRVPGSSMPRSCARSCTSCTNATLHLSTCRRNAANSVRLVSWMPAGTASQRRNDAWALYKASSVSWANLTPASASSEGSFPRRPKSGILTWLSMLSTSNSKLPNTSKKSTARKRLGNAASSELGHATCSRISNQMASKKKIAGAKLNSDVLVGVPEPGILSAIFASTAAMKAATSGIACIIQMVFCPNWRMSM
mmetsp:Transcript_88798/g.287029  ORF Transcript_88798/g.287029 Transcript_88798/m.287029 type:complete len:211 (-) Transcript_88798:1018-1650(-)